MSRPVETFVESSSRGSARLPVGTQYRTLSTAGAYTETPLGSALRGCGLPVVYHVRIVLEDSDFSITKLVQLHLELCKYKLVPS